MSRSKFSADQILVVPLQKRKEQNTLRKLVLPEQLLDFCSNDYLGFARSEKLSIAISKACKKLNENNGSTGSRLLAGNSAFAEKLEMYIAKFHNAPSGLIFNSGYDANVGLFSAIGLKGSTIIYDELIHASVHDGIKLSYATSYPFKHNDLEHLEQRLKIAEGIIYVAVESIYSMDGDYALLKEISFLCDKYNANLIVDEAHATGVTKNNGKGRVQELKLENKIFARIHTFGKGLGCHGAIVLGSNLLRDFLINFSRPFIYSTALPIRSLVAIQQSYSLLQQSGGDIKKLQKQINTFKKGISKTVKQFLIASDSPIQCIVIAGNDDVKKVSGILRNNGFDIRSILNPTVPKGKERLRICIHTFNTTKEIKHLCNILNDCFEKKRELR
ncbi:MAG: pyridoxal phosphate-dependent aminotransferase family protein [Bacteroidetes bacterium]|nr:pyridoxal phosphate-dependent aminotransferase family protein [Bacteroidota bacterium]